MTAEIIAAVYKVDKAQFVLGDLVVHDVTPVKAEMPRTKVGRLNLKGHYEGRAVKIFEAHSVDHARFIKHMSRQPAWAQYFPEILYVQDQYIISDWAVGNGPFCPRIPFIHFKTSDMTSYLQGAEALLKDLHQTAVTSDRAPGFDYVSDFIAPRFAKACEAFKLPELEAEVFAARDKLLDHTKHHVVLSHPDLTPANVIFGSDKQMVVIDNELFGSTPLAFMDELNLLYSLSVPIVKTYKPQLQNILSRSLELIESGFEGDVVLMWWMRRMGSFYKAGDRDVIQNFAAATKEERRDFLRIWPMLDILSS